MQEFIAYAQMRVYARRREARGLLLRGVSACAAAVFTTPVAQDMTIMMIINERYQRARVEIHDERTDHPLNDD